MSGRTDLGTFEIRNEVIGTIASLAAKEVKGVAEIWKGPFPWGFLPGAAGVKVKTMDQEVKVWLNLVVEYGVNIPSVVTQVQERVKEMIDRMTHLTPVEVCVGIHHVKPKG